MSKKKILWLLAGDANKASSRVRGFWIASSLEKQFGHKSTLFWKHSKLNLVFVAFTLFRYDIVIFQKTYSRYHLWLMFIAKKVGCKVFMDIDDYPSINNNPITIKNFERMTRLADGVFAGSKKLVDYTLKFQPNSYLVPSSISFPFYEMGNRFKVEKDCGLITLGWIGNGKYYKNDLIEILFFPLAYLSSKYPITLKIVGAANQKEIESQFLKIEALNLEVIDQIDWSDQNAVLESIIDFDIGLYPLLANRQNSFKCGFKALEYMILRIPIVSSDVAFNREIIKEEETGFFATNEEEWIRHLESLIIDEKRRLEMGNSGYLRVKENFSTDKISFEINEILLTKTEL